MPALWNLFLMVVLKSALGVVFAEPRNLPCASKTCMVSVLVMETFFVCRAVGVASPV